MYRFYQLIFYFEINMNLPFAVTVSLNLKPNVKITVDIVASFVVAKR